MAKNDSRTNVHLLAALALTTAGGCTAILGIGGDFRIEGNGGGGHDPTSSSSGSGGTSSTGGGGSTSSSTGSATGGSGGSGGHYPETGDITGHSLTIRIDEHGSPNGEHQAVDFTAAGGNLLEALFADGNGQWTSVSGIGNPGSDTNGNFKITTDRTGPYVLHFNTFWALLDNRKDIDLDQYAIYAADAPTVSAGNDPQARLVLTNIRPWQAGDILEFLDAETGAYAFIDDSVTLTPPIQPGATSIDSLGSYVEMIQPNRFRIASGQDVHIFHLSRYGSDPYTSIAGYAKVSNITVPDSNDTFDIAADFLDSVQRTQLKRTFHALDDKFDDQIAQVNPAAQIDVTTLSWSLQPAPYTINAQLVGTADLASNDPVPAGAGDFNITYFFGNPFPSSWSLGADFRKNATFQIQATGKNPATATLGTGGCLIIDGDPLLGDTISPQVAPLKNVKVDGAAIWNGGTARPMSLTPTLTWDAGAGRKPDAIQVVAYAVLDNGHGGSRLRNYGSIWTSGSVTKLGIPTGFLQPGTDYLFELVARYSPKAKHQSAPGRIPATKCQAATLSDTFTTAP